MDTDEDIHMTAALSGDHADRVIENMQLKFIQHGDNLLGLVNQFATDLERDSSELRHSIDESHNRVIEIGDVLEVKDKIDAIERDCNSVLANLARSNHDSASQRSASDDAVRKVILTPASSRKSSK